MGCECSKIKVCSICHEPCENYVYALETKNISIRTICCFTCVKKMNELQSEPNSVCM